MKLEHLMDYHASLKPAVDVGVGPYGARSFGEVSGGEFEGPRLKGRLLPGGGDWILVDGNGVGHIDVRAIFETDDGARIYAQYHGTLEMNERVMTALATGGDTEFGDAYFMVAPRFETGDERYAWLNDKVCVGEGRIREGGVAYRAYCVENG
jgi:hypothetical protein